MSVNEMAHPHLKEDGSRDRWSVFGWVIDQYRATTDARSGIVNDPNREDDPRAILRLLGQVIYVSVETVRIIESLPALGPPEAWASCAI